MTAKIRDDVLLYTGLHLYICAWPIYAAWLWSGWGLLAEIGHGVTLAAILYITASNIRFAKAAVLHAPSQFHVIDKEKP